MTDVLISCFYWTFLNLLFFSPPTWNTMASLTKSVSNQFSFVFCCSSHYPLCFARPLQKHCKRFPYIQPALPFSAYFIRQIGRSFYNINSVLLLSCIQFLQNSHCGLQDAAWPGLGFLSPFIPCLASCGLCIFAILAFFQHFLSSGLFTPAYFSPCLTFCGSLSLLSYLLVFIALTRWSLLWSLNAASVVSLLDHSSFSVLPALTMLYN